MHLYASEHGAENRWVLWDAISGAGPSEQHAIASPPRGWEIVLIGPELSPGSAAIACGSARCRVRMLRGTLHGLRATGALGAPPAGHAQRAADARMASCPPPAPPAVLSPSPAPAATSWVGLCSAQCAR